MPENGLYITRRINKDGNYEVVEATRALHDFSAVDAGPYSPIVTLVGPTGSGKTTVAEMMKALLGGNLNVIEGHKGDWIVLGLDDRLHVMRPQVFKRRFQPAAKAPPGFNFVTSASIGERMAACEARLDEEKRDA